MPTTRTQKPKTKNQNQTINPLLCYSTLALDWPTISNTPAPQPHYINIIHKCDQHGLNCGHYGDDRNLIEPLPNPIWACQTLLPDNSLLD